MTPPDEKHERLRDAGIITADELPEEYASVVASLTPDELEMLVSIKERLNLAERASGESIGTTWMAP
jgi:hypothetical protein